MVEDSLSFKRLDAINDFLHLPIVDDVAWHLYHIVRLLFCALGAVALLLSFLVKLCTGAFITRFEAPEGRAILITGCDSGFGHDLALELVEKGWRVYAGCLTRQGMTALQIKAADSEGTMVAVPMDVTKRADIDRVVKQIGDECPKTLFAVVNNAGVDAGGLVDWTSETIYRKVMDVNFFAMIAVCKACLPLLKERKGRIVNVTSVAGIFLGMPFLSAYAASKHAAESFSSSLRFEVEGWGIQVITVSPSYHRTAMGLTHSDNLMESYKQLDQKTKDEYGPEYIEKAHGILRKNTALCWDPRHAVNALIKATTAIDPRTQYIVGSDAVFRLLPLMKLHTPTVQKMISTNLLKGLVPVRVRQRQEQQQQQQPKKKDLKSQ